MLFINALYLAAAGTVIGPILFHLLLRDRPKRQVLPTLRFLTPTAPQSYAMHKLKNFVLLVLRTAIVLLLVTAFARPYLQQAQENNPAPAPAAAVFALDASLSMGAAERWDMARARIETLLSGLPPNSPAVLMLFDTTPEIAVAPTTDPAAILAELRRREPGNASADIVAGLNAAIEVASGLEAETRTVYLVSDFQKTGLDASMGAVSGSEGVKVVPVPVDDARPANAAVMAVRAGRGSADGSSVIADVANFGDESVTLPLAVVSNNETIGNATVALKPDERRSVEVAIPSASDDRLLNVRINSTDTVDADDAFAFVLERKQAVPLLVIERTGSVRLSDSNTSAAPPGANPYLASALTALGDVVQPTWIDPSKVEAALLSGFSVAIVAGGAPNDPLVQLLHKFVSTGGAVIAFPGTNQSGTVAGLAAAEVTGWTQLDPDTDYRLVTAVSPRGPFATAGHSRDSLLGHPRAFRYMNTQLNATAGTVVLAHFDDGSPFLLERREGEGLVYLFTVPLDSSASDLVLRAAFAPMMYELIVYASDTTKIKRLYTIGDVPPAEPSTGDAANTAARPVILRETGFRDVSRAGKTFAIAVNVDSIESDLAPAEPARIESFATARMVAGDPALLPRHLDLQASQPDEGWRIWPYLLVAVLVLMGLESIVASRTAR